MGKDTTSMSDAWGLWDRIWADDRVMFLSEPEDLEKEFRSRSKLSSRSPKFGLTLTSWHLRPAQV
jgi:hypothetical protein